jgi:hypothetical protein
LAKRVQFVIAHYSVRHNAATALREFSYSCLCFDGITGGASWEVQYVNHGTKP